jgi:hypothetical protein
MVLEAIFAKVVPAGLSKAVGWLSEGARQKINDARAARHLDADEPSLTELARTLERLQPDEAAAITAYIASPEVANLIYQIATKQLLRSHGDDAGSHEARIRSELKIGIHLALPGHEANDDLTDALLRVLTIGVQQNFELITPDDQAGISPQSRAAMVRSAADMTTTAGINLTVLSQLTDLTAIHKFELEYRTAVATLNSKMRLPHAGTSRQVPFEELFVQPTIDSVLFEHREFEEQSHDVSLADIMSITQRVIMLGDPGGGKTTSTSQLLYQIASGRAQQVVATVPFWITLRDYAPRFDSGVSIVEYLEEQCRTIYSISPPENAIEYMLLNGRAIVFFDGLDELLDTSDRQKIVAAVEGFATRYATASVVVTSRRIGYIEAALDDTMFVQLQLGPFTADQIETYAAKWFSLDDSIEPSRRETITQAFMTDSAFVRDLTSNPLMLSLMCGIYAFENYIPRNRPDVYERCSLLLFEKWDKQRGIGGEVSFDAHVQSAMRSIAFSLFSSRGSEKGLSRHQLIDHVKAYLLKKRFDNEEEAEQAATEFIDFCKGRAWVLTELGADAYGFTHGTFLEFFAASHIVRLHPNSDALMDILYDHLRKSEWDVVAQLALQILGKNVDDGADNFLDVLIDRALGEEDARVRTNLFGFAARALKFIVPRPPVLRKMVDSAVDAHCDERADYEGIHELPRSTAVGQLVSVSAENRPLVGKYLIDRILSRLEVDAGDERALALGWYLEAHGSRSAALSLGDSEYWNARSDEFHPDLEPYLEIQGHLHPWAASILVALGTLRAATMIVEQGPRSLFDLNVAGTLLVAPLAYHILNTRDDHALPDDVISEIYRTLMAQPRPWFDSSEEFDVMSYDVRFRARRGFAAAQIDAFAAANLCFLAVAELEVIHSEQRAKRESERADRRHPSPFPTLTRQEVLDRWQESVRAMEGLELPQECLDLVHRWSTGDIDFVERI